MPHLWPHPVSEGPEGEAADVGARGLAPHEQRRVKEKVGEVLRKVEVPEGMGGLIETTVIDSNTRG